MTGDIGSSDAPEAHEGGRASWGLGRFLALGAALLWLGFGIGYFVANAGSVPDENSADVGYLQDMITHHEQALTMAQYGLANGQSTEVMTFAREILLFQSYEIGLMENKLNSWGYSRQNRPETAMAWMGMGMPVESMPGLATDEQIDALATAEGLESDVMFLELMAAHHRGGADMGLAAADRADDQWVVDLSRRQARNQIIEINEFILAGERAGLPIAIEPYS